METQPVEVFSLAEYLAEEMQERGWKTEDAAVRMQTSRGVAMDLFWLDIVMCVPEEQIKLDDEFFTGLGRAFGVSAEMFNTIHQKWNDNPTARSTFNVPDDLFGPASRRAMIRVVKS